MSFHMAGVQRDLFRWIGWRGHALKYLLPDASLAPACEAVVDGLVRSIFLGTILPAAANLQNMHDPAQNASIVFALRARLVGR
jgi:hypothetical protein